MLSLQPSACGQSELFQVYFSLGICIKKEFGLQRMPLEKDFAKILGRSGKTKQKKSAVGFKVKSIIPRES